MVLMPGEWRRPRNLSGTGWNNVAGFLASGLGWADALPGLGAQLDIKLSDFFRMDELPAGYRAIGRVDIEASYQLSASGGASYYFEVLLGYKYGDQVRLSHNLLGSTQHHWAGDDQGPTPGFSFWTQIQLAEMHVIVRARRLTTGIANITFRARDVRVRPWFRGEYLSGGFETSVGTQAKVTKGLTLSSDALVHVRAEATPGAAVPLSGPSRITVSALSSLRARDPSPRGGTAVPIDSRSQVVIWKDEAVLSVRPEADTKIRIP